MLDDAAFARAWVESRDRAHPRGASALRQELRLRGVDDETVRRVLAERADAEHAPDIGGSHPAVEAEEAASADERAALRLLERRRTGLARYGDPLERRRRAYAMLARSGFDPEVCRRVAATVVGRTADGDGGGLDLEDRLDEGP